MALQRLPGSAQRYLDTDTGETISRRQYEKRFRPEAAERRETLYQLEKQERRRATGFIQRETLSENKRYWMQRYAEQAAARRGTTDRKELEIARQPGSEFNRLWAQAERQGFEGGSGSAWDALTYRAGAKGGAENEHERSKYLAVVAWYMRNTNVGSERWVSRGDAGRFTWEGMPDSQRASIRAIS